MNQLKLKPIAQIPHSPNWDTLQPAAFIYPNFFAYISNEQIVLIQLSSDNLNETQGAKVIDVFRLQKIQKTRIMAIELCYLDISENNQSISYQNHDQAQSNSNQLQELKDYDRKRDQKFDNKIKSNSPLSNNQVNYKKLVAVISLKNYLVVIKDLLYVDQNFQILDNSAIIFKQVDLQERIVQMKDNVIGFVKNGKTQNPSQAQNSINCLSDKGQILELIFSDKTNSLKDFGYKNVSSSGQISTYSMSEQYNKINQHIFIGTSTGHIVVPTWQESLINFDCKHKISSIAIIENQNIIFCSNSKGEVFLLSYKNEHEKCNLIGSFQMPEREQEQENQSNGKKTNKKNDSSEIHNTLVRFKMNYLREEEIVIFTSDRGVIYSLNLKEIDFKDSRLCSKISELLVKFQENQHSTSIQTLLQISVNRILTIGYDRLISIFEIQMSGKFTENVQRFYTLSQTVQMMSFCINDPQNLYLIQNQSVAKLLKWDLSTFQQEQNQNSDIQLSDTLNIQDMTNRNVFRGREITHFSLSQQVNSLCALVFEHQTLIVYYGETKELVMKFKLKQLQKQLGDQNQAKEKKILAVGLIDDYFNTQDQLEKIKHNSNDKQLPREFMMLLQMTETYPLAMFVTSDGEIHFINILQQAVKYSPYKLSSYKLEEKQQANVIIQQLDRSKNMLITYNKQVLIMDIQNLNKIKEITILNSSEITLCTSYQQLIILYSSMKNQLFLHQLQLENLSIKTIPAFSFEFKEAKYSILDMQIDPFGKNFLLQACSDKQLRLVDISPHSYKRNQPKGQELIVLYVLNLNTLGKVVGVKWVPQITQTQTDALSDSYQQFQEQKQMFVTSSDDKQVMLWDLNQVIRANQANKMQKNGGNYKNNKKQTTQDKINPQIKRVKMDEIKQEEIKDYEQKEFKNNFKNLQQTNDNNNQDKPKIQEVPKQNQDLLNQVISKNVDQQSQSKSSSISATESTLFSVIQSRVFFQQKKEFSLQIIEAIQTTLPIFYELTPKALLNQENILQGSSEDQKIEPQNSNVQFDQFTEVQEIDAILKDAINQLKSQQQPYQNQDSSLQSDTIQLSYDYTQTLDIKLLLQHPSKFQINLKNTLSLLITELKTCLYIQRFEFYQKLVVLNAWLYLISFQILKNFVGHEGISNEMFLQFEEFCYQEMVGKFNENNFKLLSENQSKSFTKSKNQQNKVGQKYNNQNYRNQGNQRNQCIGNNQEDTQLLKDQNEIYKLQNFNLVYQQFIDVITKHRQNWQQNENQMIVDLRDIKQAKLEQMQLKLAFLAQNNQNFHLNQLLDLTQNILIPTSTTPDQQKLSEVVINSYLDKGLIIEALIVAKIFTNIDQISKQVDINEKQNNKDNGYLQCLRKMRDQLKDRPFQVKKIDAILDIIQQKV